MFNIKLKNFKIFDSIFNIEKINYVVASDSGFNNKLKDEINSNKDNSIDLDIVKREEDPIFCKINVYGSNGESGFVIAKEDFSRNIYVMKSINGENGIDNIIREIIYDKDNVLLHDFIFDINDDVLYIKNLKLINDIDFNFDYISNKVFTFPRIENGIGYTYNKNTVAIKDEKLLISTKIQNNELVTNYIRHNLYESMDNKYLEIRMKIPFVNNIKTYIKLNSDNEDIYLLYKENDIIETRIGNSSKNIQTLINNDYNILGLFFKDGHEVELYINHKLIKTFTNLSDFNFKSLDLGNDVLNTTLLESDFFIDYIRTYTK